MDWKNWELWRWVSLILLIIGGINLGLFGLFHVDFIQTIIGMWLARLLYIFIGISACYTVYITWFNKSRLP